jgi:hypothetical protein
LIFFIASTPALKKHAGTLQSIRAVCLDIVGTCVSALFQHDKRRRGHPYELIFGFAFSSNSLHLRQFGPPDFCKAIPIDLAPVNFMSVVLRCRIKN